jgi:GTP-binding protein EngB required for normal cell division
MPVNNNKKLIAQLLLAVFILESCHGNISLITKPQTQTKTEVLIHSYNHSSTYIGTEIINDKNVVTGTTQELPMPVQATKSQDFIQPFDNTNTIGSLTINHIDKTPSSHGKQIKPYSFNRHPINELRLTSKQVYTSGATNLKNINRSTPGNHQSAPTEQRAPAIKRISNSPSSTNYSMINRLTNQTCIINGGYQVKFKKKDDGCLQAIVKDKYITGFTRQTLPVCIQPDIDYSEEAIKSSIWQKQCIHLIKGCVYVGHINLLGGDNRKNVQVEDTKEKEGEHRIEQIQAFVGAAAKNAEKAKGKNIVLVLGNTGVGKSTTINYLLESELERATTEEGDIVAVIKGTQREWARIGQNSFESETFFPDVYHNNNTSPYVYCDTPGFNDTRTEEEQLNATIATQLIVSCAESVSGIIVIVDIQDLINGKGKGMRELSLTLSRLLKGNIAPNSILFIFNDKNSSALNLENIHRKIDNLKKIETAKLEKVQNLTETGGSAAHKEYKRLQQTLSILEILNSNKDNILKINLFDDFKSKKCVEELIKNIQSTPKDKFNFCEYDVARAEFNKQLAEVLDNIICKLYKFVEAHKNIDFLNSKIESCNERIAFYESQIKLLNPQQKIKNEEQVPILEQRLKKYEQEIEVLVEKRHGPRMKVNKLRDEKDTLSDDKEILYEKSNIYYYRWFEYNGPPFTRITMSETRFPGTCEMIKPYIKEEIVDKENGTYKAYLKDYFINRATLPSIARAYHVVQHGVSIYIQAKNHPNNRLRIQQIITELEKGNEVIAAYNKEIIKLESDQDVAKNLLDYYKADIQKQKKKAADERKFLEAELSRVQREKQEAISQNARQEGIKQEAENYLDKRKNTIAAIYNLIVHGISGNEANLIEKFKEYHQHYRSILEQGTNYVTSLRKMNYPEHLICPLTQDLFLDPIVTPCGHSFSHQELLKWLNTNKSCPNCRELVNPKRLCPNLSLRQTIEDFLSSGINKN